MIKGGAKINPKGAAVPQGTILAGSELAAFKINKGRIDTLIAKAEAAKPDQQQTAQKKTVSVVKQLASLSLRPRMNAASY